MKEETVVPNHRAEEFHDDMIRCMDGVEWKVVNKNDFYTTFEVWNNETSEWADEQVEKFVDYSESYT